MNIENTNTPEGWKSCTTNRRGQDIHYLVRGEGPLIVMAHGGLGDGAMNFIAPEFVKAFEGHFTIALPDSLGHGLSGKPSDPALYTLKERAADLVAVVDDLGKSEAWYMGYSMGGWTVAGIAKYFPERCAGLVVGGWDVEEGMYRSAPNFGLTEIRFEDLVRLAREEAPPELAPEFTPEQEAALRPAINAINDLDGQAEALAVIKKPVLFWVGYDDPYHDPMLEFARRNGIPFFSSEGDHLEAMLHCAGAAAAISGYIRQRSAL
ncbi:alpha/beta hydrolase [Pseudomaricurvus alkylphenolicus]|uniref:alpha/beta fold hydrolase n=1 Tax=Pseudomaricurvus alkylphenolicus TaxID=1306991 RepID=UPI00141E476D|nr:alpha/beta hydrolase [Pseudomaricurvus alkylphenolicus]NIB42420.1 alpha/beta hydrolase [Pseudomaricurvus alkylphenolicus]